MNHEWGVDFTETKRLHSLSLYIGQFLDNFGGTPILGWFLERFLEVFVPVRFFQINPELSSLWTTVLDQSTLSKYGCPIAHTTPKTVQK